MVVGEDGERQGWMKRWKEGEMTRNGKEEREESTCMHRQCMQSQHRPVSPIVASLGVVGVVYIVVGNNKRLLQLKEHHVVRSTETGQTHAE